MEKLVQFQTAASRYDGPFDSTVGWAAAGMGYLLVTAHGRLIAIDGGSGEDAGAWLDLLAAHSTDAVPTVDLWIITHPHLDHYGALDAIAHDPALAARVNVRAIAAHFPPEFRDKTGHDNENHLAKLRRILALTGAESVTPAVDERRTIDGMTLHFLYTPTDCSILNNPNQLSLIFTVEAASGRRIMFTGDAFRRNLQIVVWRYPDSLACEILQMPHHGLCDTGLADFYTRVKASTLLIPTSIAGWRTMHSDMYGDAPAVNRAAEDAADTIYRACDGTVTLDLGGAICS